MKINKAGNCSTDMRVIFAGYFILLTSKSGSRGWMNWRSHLRSFRIIERNVLRGRGGGTSLSMRSFFGLYTLVLQVLPGFFSRNLDPFCSFGSLCSRIDGLCKCCMSAIVSARLPDNSNFQNSMGAKLRHL